MKNNYNVERISRKGEAYQWDGTNNGQVLGFLARHEMIGEMYREGQHIMIYREQKYFDTLDRGMWLVEGEDKLLRIYDNETYQLMYRPISDEPERLRAFAREILDYDRGGDELRDVGKKYGLLVAHYPKTPCGDDCVCADYYACSSWDDGGVTCYRLAESLKEVV